METWNNGMPEGLTTAGAQKLLEKYGRNELTPQKKESFFKKALHVMAEPMFLLLMIASVIYFILGEPRDGAVMLLFVTCMIPSMWPRNGRPTARCVRSGICLLRE